MSLFAGPFSDAARNSPDQIPLMILTLPDELSVETLGDIHDAMLIAQDSFDGEDTFERLLLVVRSDEKYGDFIFVRAQKAEQEGFMYFMLLNGFQKLAHALDLAVVTNLEDVISEIVRKADSLKKPLVTADFERAMQFAAAMGHSRVLRQLRNNWLEKGITIGEKAINAAFSDAIDQGHLDVYEQLLPMRPNLDQNWDTFKQHMVTVSRKGLGHFADARFSKSRDYALMLRALLLRGSKLPTNVSLRSDVAKFIDKISNKFPKDAQVQECGKLWNDVLKQEEMARQQKVERELAALVLRWEKPPVYWMAPLTEQELSQLTGR